MKDTHGAKNVFIGLAGIALAIVLGTLSITGCESPTGSGGGGFFTGGGGGASGGGSGGGPTVINIATIQGITIPVKDGTPVTTIIENEQYSGTVAWNTNQYADIDVTTFAAATAYTATITLTPKSGYTLQGIAANFFTVNGAISVNNEANSGIITADFPSTDAHTINIAAVQGVTAPANGGIPVISITENAQYSGKVTWAPYVSGTFAAVTQYTATIMLTPKSSYTLQGVAANFFTIAGATSTNNDVNSGIITAVFPQTAATVITSVSINIIAPVKGATPANATGTGNFSISTVSWSPTNNPFLGNTVYTASVTLTANNDHTFTGLNSATINGQNATISNNTGSTVTLFYTFPKTDEKAVSGIAIKTQPTKLTYTHGDALDLTGLAVTLTHDDTTTEDVAAANFTAKNVTANPAAGNNLVYSTHNNKPITITYGSQTCNTNNLTVNRATPTAADFTIIGTGSFTYNGSTRPVTVTSKEEKSNGAITVKYNGSTTIPSTANTYTVTFDVVEAEDFNAANGLSAGILTIGKATPIVDDFTVSGTGSFTYDGNPKTVTIAPKIGKSNETITVKYNGSTTAPSAIGTYPVTFDVAAGTNFNATSELSAGTLTITAATFTTTPALTLMAGNNSLNYTWTASNPVADSYDIYWKVGNNLSAADVKTGTKITGATNGGSISGLTNGTAYSVVVTANKANYNNVDSVVQTETVVPALWARTVREGTNRSIFNAVAVDSSGNVYAAGYQYGNGTYTYAPGVSAPGVSAQGTASGENVVLVKYNSSGTAQWARTVSEGTNLSIFNAVAVDSSGNVYAAGYQYGNGTYTYAPGVSAQGSGSYSNNVVLVKYDSSGTALWARTVSTGNNKSEFQAVAIDSSGNVYAAGSQYGNGTYTYAPEVSAQGNGRSENVVLVKYNSSGTAQWARTVAGTDSSSSGFNSVAVDSSGNVYAAGSQYDNGTYYTYAPGVSARGNGRVGNVVLVKYNSSGTAQWARTVSEGTNLSIFNAVAVDSSGNVYAAGRQVGNGTYTYAPGVSAQGTASILNDNVVLVKYNSSGTAQWARTVSAGTDSSRFSSVAVDSSGNVYAAGYQWGNGGPYTYAPGVSTQGGNLYLNVVLVKYNSSGTAQWARTVSGSSEGSSYFNSVAVDSSDNVYAAGCQDSYRNNTYGVGVSVYSTAGGNYRVVVLVKYGK